ncbi:MAG: D-glycero-beta-D-manno-heptose 1-phosphate adenylyltransferase [Candidatus Omnitrophota bacterium]
MNFEKKIKTLTQLKKTVFRKRKSQTVVFTNGCFDILHYGHTEYLWRAKKLGTILIVALNSDASVKKIKGKTRPINKQFERARVLAALGFVDYVTIFNEATPLKVIKEIKPDILVKGGDWKKQNIVGAEFVNSYSGKVIALPYIKGYSTTLLLEKCTRKG